MLPLVHGFIGLDKIMKKLIIFSLVLLSGLVVQATGFSGSLLHFSEKQQNPKTFMTVQNTATTTIQVGSKTTVYLDSELINQGACIKIKDEDGGGYTYLTTKGGVGTFSSQSFE